MDRSLATLLRSLQVSRNHEDATRLLPSATGLLSRLSHPLNVTLLASQLLTRPSLYSNPVRLSVCRSIFSVYYTAALRFVEDEANLRNEQLRSHLSRAEWTKAVIKGADENSPRWRHLLLLGGLLLGFDGQDAQHLPGDLRGKIEGAIVAASNLALQERDTQEANSQLAVVFVLNTVFPLLSDHNRAQILYDLLLPELVEATFFSSEGLEHGYWLSTIDRDIEQISNSRFGWRVKSLSAIRVREIKSRPLVSSLGPLARLTAHSIEHVHNPYLLTSVLVRIGEYSRNLALSWKQNKLSEVAQGEEQHFLDDETIHNTLPDLFQLLRNSLFAITIMLRSIMGRILLDSVLSSDQRAPALAIQILHILRDTYFISHRFGQHSSSQYTFVYYTAIDMLNQFPTQAETFLTNIRPSQIGTIPSHPLDRLNDLFFLNVSEHFTLTLSTNAAETLFINAALPYITTSGDSRLTELYEAAHSVLLAVFAAPHNSTISTKYIPFYIETLLQSFPTTLSPRQFRLAIRNIMQISAPHSPIAAAMPALQEIILDLLSTRLPTASENTLPFSHDSPPDLSDKPVLSEKSILFLSIIDSLSFISPLILEEWLATTARLLYLIHHPDQRGDCQRHFWAVLSDGRLDVERSAVGVAWWTSKMGREMTLYGREDENTNTNTNTIADGDESVEAQMSGGLQVGAEEAKL